MMDSGKFIYDMSREGGPERDRTQKTPETTDMGREVFGYLRCDAIATDGG